MGEDPDTFSIDTSDIEGGEPEAEEFIVYKAEITKQDGSEEEIKFVSTYIDSGFLMFTCPSDVETISGTFGGTQLGGESYPKKIISMERLDEVDVEPVGREIIHPDELDEGEFIEI